MIQKEAGQEIVRLCLTLSIKLIVPKNIFLCRLLTFRYTRNTLKQLLMKQMSQDAHIIDNSGLHQYLTLSCYICYIDRESC